MGAWRIRITGKHRKDIDRDLIVQAVIALGEQLRGEERQAAATAAPEQTRPDTGPVGGAEAAS